MNTGRDLRRTWFVWRLGRLRSVWTDETEDTTAATNTGRLQNASFLFFMLTGQQRHLLDTFVDLDGEILRHRFYQPFYDYFVKTKRVQSLFRQLIRAT